MKEKQTEIPVEKIQVKEKERKAGKSSTIKSLNTCIKNLESAELCTEKELEDIKKIKVDIVMRYIAE